MAFLLIETPEGLLESSVIFETGTSVVLTEIHRDAAQVTENPVESGVNVADHVRPENPTCGLEVLISDTPTRRDINFDTGDYRVVSLSGIPEKSPPKPGTPGSLSYAITSSGPANPVFAELLQFDPFDPRIEMYNVLLDAHTDSKIVQVHTSIRRYPDMVIVSLDAARSPQDGNGLRITMDFRQIRKVSLETVSAPIPEEPRGAPTVAKGNQYAADPELRAWLLKREASETNRQTLTKKLVSGLEKYL